MTPIVFLAPMNAEGVFRRTVRELGDVAPAYADMTQDSNAEPAGYLVREARRMRDDFLAEPAHLVAHSGGAAVALMVAARHADSLRSLTLIEPPWIGNDDWGPEELAFRSSYDALADVEPERFWEAFARVFAPDAEETPRDPAPGAGALQKEVMMQIWRTYRATPLDRTGLRDVNVPVLLPVGDASGARPLAAARELEASFPSASVEVFDGCHHFDLPYAAGPRLAASLSALWGAA